MRESTTRILVSQYTASMYGAAGKRRIEKEKRITWAVSGFIDGTRTLAIDDGHHAYLASLMNGEEPNIQIYSGYPAEDEAGFIDWLRDHIKEGPWYDLATAEYVREAIPLGDVSGH